MRRPGRKVLEGRPWMMIMGIAASSLAKVKEALLVVLSHDVTDATNVWLPACGSTPSQCSLLACLQVNHLMSRCWGLHLQSSLAVNMTGNNHSTTHAPAGR